MQVSFSSRSPEIKAPHLINSSKKAPQDSLTLAGEAEGWTDRHNQGCEQEATGVQLYQP